VTRIILSSLTQLTLTCLSCRSFIHSDQMNIYQEKKGIDLRNVRVREMRWPAKLDCEGVNCLDFWLTCFEERLWVFEESLPGPSSKLQHYFTWLFSMCIWICVWNNTQFPIPIRLLTSTTKSISVIIHFRTHTIYNMPINVLKYKLIHGFSTQETN